MEESEGIGSLIEEIDAGIIQGSKESSRDEVTDTLIAIESCSDDELDRSIYEDGPCKCCQDTFQPERVLETIIESPPFVKSNSLEPAFEYKPSPATFSARDIPLHEMKRNTALTDSEEEVDGIFRARSQTAPNLHALNSGAKIRPITKTKPHSRRNRPRKSLLQRSYKKVQGFFIGTQLSTSYDNPDGRQSSVESNKRPKLVRLLRGLVCSKSSQYRTAKAVLGFISGILFVCLLFLVFYFSSYLFEKPEDISVPENWSYAVASIFAFLAAVGLTVSVAIRCIVCLMLPALFTTRGRAVLFALILQLLITGPVQNMTDNAKLISESTNCQIELLGNQTTEVLDFLVNRTTELSTQYRDSFNRIVVNNLRTLKDALDFRHKILKDIGVSNVENVGLTFHNITFYLRDFTDYNNSANFTPFYESPSVNSSKSIKNLFNELKDDFSERIKFLQDFLDIARRVLPWSVLLVFLQSLFYRRGYRSRIEYDNIYITSKFKNLDHNRKKEKKQYVMPLKRREKSNLIDSTSCLLSRREFSSFIVALAIFLIFVLIGGLVIASDYGLSSLLSLIRTHGDTTLFYRGGAGFTATLPLDSVSPAVRQLLLNELPQVFDRNSTRLMYEASADTGKCLAEPKPPYLTDQTKVVVLAALYVFVFIVSLLQAYILRLQHKVAAYFYPEQEHRRVVYLYHSIRAQRISIKGLLYKNIKALVLRRGDSDAEAIKCRQLIALRFPQTKRVLETLGILQKIDCSACGSEILIGGHKFGESGYACDTCIENVQSNKHSIHGDFIHKLAH